MATQYQNLSDYDPDLLPTKEVLAKQCYAIAVADWNPRITHALLTGAVECLKSNGVQSNNINVVHVPGTFELIHAAKKFLFEKSSGNSYDAIIVLGCVVQGDTPHFDYVCQGVTEGVASLNTVRDACPVIFGVLTTSNMQQAIDRAGGIHGNKGVEAAITAIKMANILW
ncbi:MAG: 6,7-dimethyl-8-ribityllumazine synthase [Paludibacter sp.]|nr:6,7-dimethyl-8-ribityllumazine synthase [Paludibacter sp.]